MSSLRHLAASAALDAITFTPGVTAQQAQEEGLTAEAFLASLTPQRGSIALPGGVAKLELPQGFYYLSPDDTQRVLEDAWGNPPGGDYLGMLVPSRYSVLDNDSWAVIVSYEEEGYVDDSDAADIDYDELLTQMKRDTEASSEYRVSQGYETVRLAGWATPPRYDATEKKLYWAKELVFGEDNASTLNYDVRVLGRRGVLVMSMVASLDQLDEVQAATPDVLQLATFTDGNTYADFDPDLDQVAAYGVGALIAGKVASKVGLLAKFGGLLILLKKFWIIGVLALWAGFKALFRGRGA